jgi:hypothetical protein
MVECFHPGNDVDLRVALPTDLRRSGLEAAPVLGYASAQCGAGPQSEVHARSLEAGGAGTASAGAGPIVTSGPAGGDGLFRPNHGELQSSASAWAHDVAVLGGVVRIGSVSVDGASAVTGTPGGQKTEAHVHLDDVSVGGVHFSVDGNRLVIAGQAVPVDSLPARTVLAGAAAALAPLGCTLSIIGATDRYPQGFVLSRKDPPIGVRADGTLAASMASGLLVVCDLEQDLTAPTGFSPQRAQVLIGFVYTSASANEEVGGFGIGDLAPPEGSVKEIPSMGTDSLQPVAPAVVPAVPGTVQPSAPAPTVAPRPRATPSAAPVPVAFRAVVGAFGKWPVWLGALLLWLLTTHLGVRRLQRRLAEVAP